MNKKKFCCPSKYGISKIKKKKIPGYIITEEQKEAGVDRWDKQGSEKRLFSVASWLSIKSITLQLIMLLFILNKETIEIPHGISLFLIEPKLLLFVLKLWKF